MRIPALAKLILATVVIMAPASAQVRPEKRVALVIGIEDYAVARKLANPVRDARAVEVALKDLGFTVVTETNRNKRRLMGALEDFAEEAKGADVALVFFAGHGVQIAGRNYLLPTDTRLNSREALESSAIPLDDVFARIAEVAPRRIILLDACRNDPFGGKGSGEGRGAVVADDAVQAITPGLGRIGAVDSAIYAFSTAPGQTAADGDGEHSPFATALVTHLRKQGLEFRSVMTLIQMEVYERSSGRQLPYVEAALPGLFFVDTKGEPLPERDRLLLAMAGIDRDARAQVERVALARSVPLAPLFGAFLAAEAELGKGDVEVREKRLARAAEDFIKVRLELKTLASADQQVAVLRTSAERELSLGAFDAARDALSRAIELDRSSGDALEARLKERNLSEAATRAARAGVARTRVDYRAAIADFAAAARLAERWDKALAWRYTVDQADDLESLGNEFGDNAALDSAITAYRVALSLAPREAKPADWAKTQNNLGNALQMLGGRERDTAKLEASVAAYRAALEERTRERMPLDWAKTQNNLGNSLWKLAERERGSERLKQAIAAFRAALQEITREQAPLDWATAQNNLGVALQALAAREGDVAQLEEAIVAFRAALTERPRERAPLQWAATQNNIGVALQTIAEHTDDAAKFEEAIAAYRAALAEYTRERMPIEWATTQNNLGSSLRLLGSRETGTGRLEEAVAAFQAALTELTRERVPLDWAGLQNNLGNAYANIGERTNDPARLKLAVTAYREALKERTRAVAPLQWASIQHNLGATLLAGASRASDIPGMEEAVIAYRAALEERKRETMPLEFALSHTGLGLALWMASIRDVDATRVEQAAASFQAAIEGFEAAGNAQMTTMARGGLKTVEQTLELRRKFMKQ